jgi:hypothetical protein
MGHMLNYLEGIYSIGQCSSCTEMSSKQGLMSADNLPAMAQRTTTIRQSTAHSGKRYIPIQPVSDVQGIAIFGSIFRNTVNPTQFGVVLTYALHAALGTFLSTEMLIKADR